MEKKKKKTALDFLVTSISILFFIVFHQFTFPPAVYEGYLFFISSPTLIISCLLDNRHSDLYEVVSLIMVLTHIPHRISDAEHFFMCLLAICHVVQPF